LKIGLTRGAQIASIAVIVGTMATGSAMANANCSQVNGSWTTDFNNSVYDCDANAAPPNTGPAPECSILLTAQGCCDDGSSPGEEKTCICAVYDANTTLLNGISITTNQCGP